MNRSFLKTLSRLLALAGAAMLAWAGFSWFRAGNEVETWTAKIAEQQTEVKTLRTDLHGMSLQFQAFQKSFPSMPDSVRQISGETMRETQRYYESNIRKMEMTERDLNLEISRSKRKLAEAEKKRKSAALPVAGGGAAAWLGAALLGIAARGSRKAA